MISVNGAAIGAIPPDSDFYRDFTPGTYSFSVEPYGTPTGDADTVQLLPGSQTYLNVQWVQTWEIGYPSTGKGRSVAQFLRAEYGAAAGPGVSADPELSRRALIAAPRGWDFRSALQATEP